MQTYEPCPGEHIRNAILGALDLAKAKKDDVQMSFNDTIVVLRPNSDPEAIAKEWNDKCEQARKEYLESNEYKESQRLLKQKEKQKELLLKGALAVSPKRMTIADKVAWQEWQKNNTDPYGKATIEYAERWARLMEGRIANGDTVENCAEEARHIADNGITGFMYGCAVNILFQVWVHGDELRRWHNLDTQISDEGEKANETGTVLNPAILNLRVPND